MSALWECLLGFVLLSASSVRDMGEMKASGDASRFMAGGTHGIFIVKCEYAVNVSHRVMCHWDLCWIASGVSDLSTMEDMMISLGQPHVPNL